jgi:hypothetical protein
VGNSGIDKRIERHPPEDRVIKIGHEILKTNKGAGVRDRPVLQAQQNAVAERIADQSRQKKQ